MKLAGCIACRRVRTFCIVNRRGQEMPTPKGVHSFSCACLFDNYFVSLPTLSFAKRFQCCMTETICLVFVSVISTKNAIENFQLVITKINQQFDVLENINK